jgi:3',5'-cyclic AMP phosphodiesterase CpdA
VARIVHLSDLHFGAHDPRLVEAVEWQIDELKPDLVVVSGDFTQRARTEQFREACEFLALLRERGHEVLGVRANVSRMNLTWSWLMRPSLNVSDRAVLMPRTAMPGSSTNGQSVSSMKRR